MEISLKTKKSAGVRVTSVVHKLIAAGNAARSAHAWQDAAREYQEALRLDPSLTHIWLQLGHAEKELGRFEPAEAAYLQAALKAPMLAEAYLHLGHIQKLRGDMAGAGRYYLRAARLDSSNVTVVEEVRRFIHSAPEFVRPDMLALLRREILDEDELTSIERFQLHSGQGSLLFDVSALVAAVLEGRSFSEAGLQGHAIIPAALSYFHDTAFLCAHVKGFSRWLPISNTQFARIIEIGTMARVMGRYEREDMLTNLHLPFLFAPPFAMPQGAKLIDVDARHAAAEHYLFVQAARRESGVRYIAFSDGELAPELLAETDLHYTEATTTEAIDRAIASVPAASRDVRPRDVTLNRFVRLAKSNTGLGFRTGTSWLEPEAWGCWADKPGGELEMSLPENAVALQAYILLRGLPQDSMEVEVLLGDGRRIVGRVERDERKWFLVRDLPSVDGVARLKVSGEHSRMVRIGQGEDVLPASTGVVGFYICEQADHAARSALLEAITFGDLKHLE